MLSRLSFSAEKKKKQMRENSLLPTPEAKGVPTQQVVHSGPSETFVKWINSRLRERRAQGKVDLVRDLVRDLRDGVVLYHLLEEVSGESLRGKLLDDTERPQTKLQALSNLNVYFAGLRDLGVNINVSADDVYDGKLKRILGLLWTQFLFFAIKENGGSIMTPRTPPRPPSVSNKNSTSPPQQQRSAPITPMHRKSGSFLMRSSRLKRQQSSGDIPTPPPPPPLSGSPRTIEGEDVGTPVFLTELKRSLMEWATHRGDTAFSKETFRDGQVFAALLRRYDVDAPPFDTTLTPEANLRRTFHRAEAALGVPALIDAVDDEKALLAYLCEFKHCCLSLREHHVSPVDRAPAKDDDDDRQQEAAEEEAPQQQEDDFEEEAPEEEVVVEGHGEEIEEITAVDNLDDDDDDDDDDHVSVGDEEEAWEAADSRAKSSGPASTTSSGGESSATVPVATATPTERKRYEGKSLFPQFMVSPSAAAAATKRIKVAVSLIRARGLFGGRGLNPYCILKYGDVEVKTKHVAGTGDPVWHHHTLFDVKFPIRDKAHAVVVIYVLSANSALFGGRQDSLLGRVELLLWNLLQVDDDMDDPGFDQEMGGLHDDQLDDDDDALAEELDVDIVDVDDEEDTESVFSQQPGPPQRTVTEELDDDEDDEVTEEDPRRGVGVSRTAPSMSSRLISLRKAPFSPHAPGAGVPKNSLDFPRDLMKRSFLAVVPCDTSELDNLRKSARKNFRPQSPQHDSRVLFKNAGYLGALELSVFSLGRVVDPDLDLPDSAVPLPEA